MIVKFIDMHSHWSTERGYVLRTPEELAQQIKTWRSEPKYRTEDEMATDLRAAGVKVILDLSFTKKLPIEETAELHDYAFSVQKKYPDCVLGNWIQLRPESGVSTLREFRRCVDANAGFLGLGISGAGGAPASDPVWKPFYDLCSEANVPVLIFVGHTGLGAGLPGGGGIILDDCHPRHLDRVAATNPKLKIIAGRPAWPWQTEMISILLHKPNVWCELHGWSPKYFTPELKREIPGRLRRKIMFGADYPLFTYERLERDWRSFELPDDVLADVFVNNAEKFLANVRGGHGS